MSEILEIASLLRIAGLSDKFIEAAVRASANSDVAYRLMILWRDENTSIGQKTILADLRGVIEDL